MICDPDSTVRSVYTLEIGSALPGELNWVFDKGAIGIGKLDVELEFTKWS